jgi:DnaK suppressor protein
MSIDTDHFRQKLQQREKELTEEIGRFATEARESSPGDVEDPVDQVESTEAKAANFSLINIRNEELSQVRNALRRIEEGTYGECLDCGRPIEANRLEAVPWAPYCIADQERREAMQQENDDDAQGVNLRLPS